MPRIRTIHYLSRRYYKPFVTRARTVNVYPSLLGSIEIEFLVAFVIDRQQVYPLVIAELFENWLSLDDFEDALPRRFNGDE